MRRILVARASEEGHSRRRARPRDAVPQGPGGEARSGGACGLVSWRGGVGGEAGKVG